MSRHRPKGVSSSNGKELAQERGCEGRHYRCDMSQMADEQDPAVDIEEQFESSRRFLDEWLTQLRDPSFQAKHQPAVSQHSFQACHVSALLHSFVP